MHSLAASSAAAAGRLASAHPGLRLLRGACGAPAFLASPSRQLPQQLRARSGAKLCALAPVEARSTGFSRRSVRAMAAAPVAPGKARVAVGQMTAVNDLDKNYEVCKRLAGEAKAAGAVLLCLPENFSYIGTTDTEALAVAEPLSGKQMARFKAIARDTGLWLSLGGFQEVGPDPARRFNTHVLINSEGEIVSSYRKIHLFDIDIPNGPKLQESNGTAPGGDLVTVDTPAGRLGLTICYDLRFPELYQRLRFEKGAQLLLVPAAFTKPTGQAHWEILLRARAVECQCYVLAAAQAGVHNEKRESYGHSMIIDPWGSVVARAPDSEGTCIATADIDLSLVSAVRTRMPIESHRRPDLYGFSAAKK